MNSEGLQMVYFVLKPRGISKHAEASRTAMRAYAAAIEPYEPALARELRLWITREAEEHRNFLINEEQLP